MSARASLRSARMPGSRLRLTLECELPGELRRPHLPQPDRYQKLHPAQ